MARHCMSISHLIGAADAPEYCRLVRCPVTTSHLELCHNMVVAQENSRLAGDTALLSTVPACAMLNASKRCPTLIYLSGDSQRAAEGEQSV